MLSIQNACFCKDFCNKQTLTAITWYTDAKLDEKDIGALNEVILEYPPHNEGEEIMSTVAANYIQTGMAQGIAQRKATRDAEIIKNLLSMKKPISEIKMITA